MRAAPWPLTDPRDQGRAPRRGRTEGGYGLVLVAGVLLIILLGLLVAAIAEGLADTAPAVEEPAR